MLGVLKQLFELDSQKNTNSFVHQFITHHQWHVVYQASMLMLRNCNHLSDNIIQVLLRHKIMFTELMKKVTRTKIHLINKPQKPLRGEDSNKSI